MGQLHDRGSWAWEGVAWPTRSHVVISQEMGGEFYSRGGELEGEFRVPYPHFDSPLMLAPMTDRNYVVMRMKYQGYMSAANGSFYFRSGAQPPPPLYAKVCAWG